MKATVVHNFRTSPELMAAIDRVRGKTPRNRWLTDLVQERLRLLESYSARNGTVPEPGEPIRVSADPEEDPWLTV